MRRAPTLLAVPALLLSAAARAQAPPPELLARELRAVRLEREAELARAWGAAAPELRERARQRLLAARRTAERGLARPDLYDRPLAEAWLMLRGAAPDAGEGPPVALLAAALDVRVVPGAFAAREDGRGEPMVAHLRTLFAVALEQQVEVGLYWVAPDGTETRARLEPVHPDVIDTQGFEMYLRPPAGAPGRFQLVPEVARGAVRQRGFPVPVDCVERPEERLERLEARARGGDAVARVLAEPARAVHAFGVRGLGGLTLEDALRLGLEDGAPTTPLLPRTLSDAGLDAVVWTRSEAAAPRSRTLLVACGPLESPPALLAGASGAAWAAAAAALEAELLVTDLPALAASGPDLVALARGLLAGDGARALWIVARGDTGVLLPPRLRRGELPGVDALVVCASRAAQREPRFALGLPLLAIDAGCQAAATRTGGEGAATWTWVQLEEPAPVADRELPERVRAWLEALPR